MHEDMKDVLRALKRPELPTVVNLATHSLLLNSSNFLGASYSLECTLTHKPIVNLN